MTTNVENIEFADQRYDVNQDERQSEQMEISEHRRVCLHQCIIYFMQMHYIQEQSNSASHESVYIAHKLCEIDEKISHCERQIRSYRDLLCFTRVDFNKVRDQLVNSNIISIQQSNIYQIEFTNLNKQCINLEKKIIDITTRIHELNTHKQLFID